MSQRNDDQDQAETGLSSALSRRNLVAAGVAGGLGMGLAVNPEPANAADRPQPAAGARGSTVVEFRGRIDPSGTTGDIFTSYGYLTNVSHIRRPDIFSASTHNESTALLTAFARGDLRARVLDTSVHSLDIVGRMTIFQRVHGGADFSDPASFRVGEPVARYHLVLQDILTVFSAGQGLPTLTGDMTQTRASALSGPLAGRSFGRRGSRLRMFATGLGHLVDPVTLNAQLEIAGNWSVE
jgi:hypothetical protein